MDGRFGSTNAKLIDDVRCHGYEKWIIDCMLVYCIGINCYGKIDVGVLCVPPPSTTQSTIPWVPPPIATTPIYQTRPPASGIIPNYGNCSNNGYIVRLLRTPELCIDSGVVQVYLHNQWVGICDDFWQKVDAQVICRMLCYDTSQAIAGSGDFDLSIITEPIMVTDVTCAGNEADIRLCNYTYTGQPPACNQNEMAKVSCSQLTVTPSIQPPDLSCENSMITANFTASWQGFVPHSQLTLVWHQTGLCLAQKNDYGTYITLSIPFGQCGTIRTWNSTHIIYKNAILYVPAATGLITRVKTYMIFVQCEIDRRYYVEKPILPATVTAIASAPGNYTVLMHFYTDNFVTVITQYPVQIPVGNWLYVAIELITTEIDLILIVTSCYATPSSNRLDPIRYSLFSDKCKDDQTVCLISLSDHRYGFYYQTFKFVQYNEVHIHCEAYVCPKEDQSQECDRSCFRNTQGQIGKRKRREADLKIIYIKSDVILMYDPADENGGHTYFDPTKPSYPDKFTTPGYHSSTVDTPNHLTDNILIASNEASKDGNKESENNKEDKEPEQPNPTNSSMDSQIVFTTLKVNESNKEIIEQNENDEAHAPGNTETPRTVTKSDDTTNESKLITSTIRVKEVTPKDIEEELKSMTSGSTNGAHSATIHSGSKDEITHVSSLKPTNEMVTRAPTKPKFTTTQHHETVKSVEVPEEVKEANATFGRLVMVGNSATRLQSPRFAYFVVLIMASVTLLLI